MELLQKKHLNAENAVVAEGSSASFAFSAFKVFSSSRNLSRDSQFSRATTRSFTFVPVGPVFNSAPASSSARYEA